MSESEETKWKLGADLEEAEERAALQSLEYLQHGAIVHLGEVVEAMKSFCISSTLML